MGLWDTDQGVFADREEAGRRLARRLEGYRGSHAVVLGLPRGGVVVAHQVARALALPLDVIVVRKLGVPYQPEYAMGAIGEGGIRVLDRDVVDRARVGEAQLAAVEMREREALAARVERFRRGRTRVDLRGRVAIVVDDGIATGSTARAACIVARGLGAQRVVLAVPVGPSDTVHDFPEADEVICLVEPEPFFAVGYHYRDFGQTSDDEVVALLDDAARHLDPPGARAVDEEVRVPTDGVTLAGHLSLPAGARGVVVFAHGSGSSRHSPRNQFVASELRAQGLGTLLLDLLTPAEEDDRANVFDIGLLAGCLLAATRWVAGHPAAAGARIGLFGASTGAGAALVAAAAAPELVAAVVSRGGRVDLAGARLTEVRAPTRLIVGGSDYHVLDLNEMAHVQLRCEKDLVVVPRASHLFEEPGALEEVARLAAEWFVRHLGGNAAPAG